jgi:transposase-like protein
LSLRPLFITSVVGSYLFTTLQLVLVWGNDFKLNWLAITITLTALFFIVMRKRRNYWISISLLKKMARNMLKYKTKTLTSCGFL